MFLITKEEFKELTNVKQANCISIFIPTNRAGEQVLQEKDAIKLKNQLKEVKSKLEDKELSPNEINEKLSKVEALIDDSSFWREQSDGLAIYIADDIFKVLTLPVDFEEFNYVNDSFYVTPLMPMFEGDGLFYILHLERRNVKLYEATQHSFTEIIIDDCIPTSIKDRVGYDYEEKNLQFRAGQEGSGHALYHGQEAATGKSKLEITQYLRAINDGIEPLIREDNYPMIVVAQDFMFDIYKEMNTYKNLYPENVIVDFSDTDMYEVHELAWDAIAIEFDRKREDNIKQFIELEGTGRTDTNIGTILSAIKEGKVEAVFIEKGKEIYGTIREDDLGLSVVLSENDKNSISLMNVVATKTFAQGGYVYLLDHEKMPNENSEINALYRY